MGWKFAGILLGCVLAASRGAQAADKQQELNLDWKGGAVYFKFPEGAQVKVTDVNCPVAATVSIACRTATRARCGSWYLGRDQTATAGAKAQTGIAALNYSGPRGSNCTATAVVHRP